MDQLGKRFTAAGPAILLRAFFGVTFTFAGLQKLANPNFFNAASLTSFQSQVRGAMGSSPIAPLLRLTLHAAVPIAVLVAIAEVLIGLGTLVGFLARPAAAGGAALSLSFFLSISYGTSPYYYGSDIVFFFGWTVLLLGGAGPLSLDAALARAGTDANGAPVTRRTVLGRGVIAGLGVVVSGALIGLDAGIGRLARRSTSSGSQTTGSAGSSNTSGSSGSSGDATRGVRLASTTEVGVGSAYPITDPQGGGPGFVVHDAADSFVAFSAICTHAGCTVNFDGSGERFLCPCHGSIYNAKTGAVEQGPAVSPLPAIPIEVEGGSIYLKRS